MRVGGKEEGITSSRVGWGGVTRINHINTNRASLPETPTVLYSLISNKSTSVCWDYCERKGTGEKCEKQMSKERARQSTEGITVCCKHWHSHASGPRSLPPSFFPTLHSSHGHTALCVCVCVLTNQPCCIMKTLSSYNSKEKINIPGPPCWICLGFIHLYLSPSFSPQEPVSPAPLPTVGYPAW